jgi:hypothetical protein
MAIPGIFAAKERKEHKDKSLRRSSLRSSRSLAAIQPTPIKANQVILMHPLATTPRPSELFMQMSANAENDPENAVQSHPVAPSQTKKEVLTRKTPGNPHHLGGHSKTSQCLFKRSMPHSFHFALAQGWGRFT